MKRAEAKPAVIGVLQALGYAVSIQMPPTRWQAGGTLAGSCLAVEHVIPEPLKQTGPRPAPMASGNGVPMGTWETNGKSDDWFNPGIFSMPSIAISISMSPRRSRGRAMSPATTGIRASRLSAIGTASCG